MKISAELTSHIKRVKRKTASQQKNSSREATTPSFLSSFGAGDCFGYISSLSIDPVPSDSKDSPQLFEIQSSPELDPQRTCAIEEFKLPKKKTAPEDAIETEPAFQNYEFLTLDYLFHKDIDISVFYSCSGSITLKTENPLTMKRI
ncbi:hypothetical protein [Parasitella parasitica]|uniref:Uncharacterized protein n=1 Tax=Parasitella parasitica TaxID=35722 RepID=A0A0B7NVI7_9FUNG|nr:hypothetical protein [Parasitella parasitica]